ncbi:MAG: DUF3307 domain-containing protein [Elusimicrobiota bacterium]|nr:DUF3307 domain-containing protein [Elusimicrobiota bacterium]
MFIFYRLLLAHVIADFPLQFTSLYRFKTKSPLGSFVHSGIFGLLAVLLAWPYWNLTRMWGFIFFLWFVHAIQDWLKVLVFEKYRLNNIWVFILDQFLHIGFLGMLFPLGLAKLALPENLSRLVFLYNDNNVIIYAIAFVSIGFGGGIFISYIKNLCYGGKKVDLTSPKKYIQAVERMLIAGLMLLKGYYYLVIPGIWIIHGGYVIFKKRNEERFSFSSFFDLIFNTAIAVGIMLILKLS